MDTLVYTCGSGFTARALPANLVSPDCQIDFMGDTHTVTFVRTIDYGARIIISTTDTRGRQYEIEFAPTDSVIVFYN